MEEALKINAAGIRFHASQMGQQPRAVFLHGFSGDRQVWDGMWSLLAGKLSALRYDQRGFGQSIDASHAPFTHADDLLAILNALDIDQCDLIGLSMGGAVALNFALNHPRRVRKLILISPGMVAWEWSEEWRVLWRQIIAKARSGKMDEARQLWWQHPIFSTTRDGAAGATLHESIMRYSGAHWIHDDEKLMMPDVERLHSLQASTLLLTGTADQQDFRLIASLIEASAPNVSRIDFPSVGHLLPLEYPAGCAHEILSFL